MNRNKVSKKWKEGKADQKIARMGIDNRLRSTYT